MGGERERERERDVDWLITTDSWTNSVVVVITNGFGLAPLEGW